MSHKIQKQVLQLDIPSGHDSWRFQNQLRDTFNVLVLPRLEKVCDELGLDEGTVLKIDSLLLDTGEISSGGLSQDWINQIEYQFKEQIKMLRIKGPSATENVEVQTSDQSDLNALLHFLKLAVLPWWAKNDGPQSFRELLDNTLTKAPKTLIARLRKLPNRQLAIRRLLKLLAPEQVQILNQALNITSTLSEQVNTLLAQLEIRPSSEALLRLNSIELIRHLTEKPQDNEDIIYEWALGELRFGSKAKELTQNIYNTLINNYLKSIKEVKIESKFLEVIVKAFKRLEKEQRLNTSADYDSTFRDTKRESAAKRDKEYGANEELTNVSDTKSESAIGHANGQLNTKSSDLNNDTNSQKTGAQRPDSKTNENKSQTNTDKREKETTDSFKQQAQSKQNTKADSAPSPANVNEEDAHVFKQLERIRKAARENKGAESTAAETDQVSGNQTDQSQASSDLNTDSILPTDKATGLNQDIQSTENSEFSASDPANSNQATKPKDELDTARYSYELPQVEVEECYLANAGLILFWPFLGRFFKNMGYVENSTFKSVEAQEKACLLLQYLLGDQPELDEFALPLNKLLCALPIEHPITTEHSLSDVEKEGCQELLQSTIDNWGMLKGTSIAGFQSSFLNREAVLKKQENGWLLQVDKQAFDMLLEQLPWPLSIVKITWMNEPIYVEW